MPAHHLNALILGGGIAGLWTLARLAREGFSALLLTDAPLGAGQTIASQGIIHGGIKYTLGLAEPGDASRRIAEMPGIWRACLEGRGEVDLRAARVLSDHQHLWTTPGVLSRIAGLGASRVIRTAVVRIAPDRRPEPFASAPRSIDLYRVEESVLDIGSVVRALAEPLADRIRRIAFPGGIRFAGDAVEILDAGGAEHRLAVDRIILAAGAGNEALMNLCWRDPAPVPQRRPLHMVIATFPETVGAPALFGHCLGSSTLPRLTVTTAGRSWYIGGQIAETGVARSETDQVAAAREELRACLPWIDLSSARFSTLRIDRAEAVADRALAGRRPDGPVIAQCGGVIAAWPTKLAFAPALADDILARFRAASVTPASSGARALPDLPHPGFAAPPWIEPPVGSA